MRPGAGAAPTGEARQEVCALAEPAAAPARRLPVLPEPLVLALGAAGYLLVFGSQFGGDGVWAWALLVGLLGLGIALFRWGRRPEKA